jgi:hypothetical protein
MISFGFLKTEGFNIAFSVLLGVAIVSLFRAACKGDGCKIVKAPPIDEIKAATYQLGDTECYQFRTQTVECPQKGVIEGFERF